VGSEPPVRTEALREETCRRAGDSRDRQFGRSARNRTSDNVRFSIQTPTTCLWISTGSGGGNWPAFRPRLQPDLNRPSHRPNSERCVLAASRSSRAPCWHHPARYLLPWDGNIRDQRGRFSGRRRAGPAPRHRYLTSGSSCRADQRLGLQIP
jgi:hypothetical protein